MKTLSAAVASEEGGEGRTRTLDGWLRLERPDATRGNISVGPVVRGGAGGAA